MGAAAAVGLHAPHSLGNSLTARRRLPGPSPALGAGSTCSQMIRAPQLAVTPGPTARVAHVASSQLTTPQRKVGGGDVDGGGDDGDGNGGGEGEGKGEEEPP